MFLMISIPEMENAIKKVEIAEEALEISTEKAEEAVENNVETAADKALEIPVETVEEVVENTVETVEEDVDNMVIVDTLEEVVDSLVLLSTKTIEESSKNQGASNNNFRPKYRPAHLNNKGGFWEVFAATLPAPPAPATPPSSPTHPTTSTPAAWQTPGKAYQPK